MESSRVLGQEMTGEEEKVDEDLSSAAEERKLSARGKLKVFKPGNEGTLSKYAVDTRRVLTRKWWNAKRTGKHVWRTKGTRIRN